MFKFQPNPIHEKLDKAITEVLNALIAEEPQTEKYERINDQLQKLYAMRNESRSRRVSPDVLAQIIANLLGIGIIVSYEQKHIVTSKALGFVKKLF